MKPKNQPVSDLPKLAAPARRALDAAGIQQLGQLTQFSEVEIKQLHGIGPNALDQLRHALATNGLSFAAEQGRKKTAQNGAAMKTAEPKDEPTPAQLITNHIAELADWRGKMLARLRQLILAANPGLTEEWKWGTPVWSHKGNVVAVGAFKDHLKINFFKGASLSDPHGLFNTGLDAKAMRAIDLHEGDKINEAALKELIRAAVALNTSGGKKK
jgi:hypothetical protein